MRTELLVRHPACNGQVSKVVSMVLRLLAGLFRCVGRVLGCSVVSRGIRGMGEPKAGLNNAMVVGAVNLVLDPVLMFGCGLGVAGAAMATEAAHWVRR